MRGRHLRLGHPGVEGIQRHHGRGVENQVGTLNGVACGGNVHENQPDDCVNW